MSQRNVKRTKRNQKAAPSRSQRPDESPVELAESPPVEPAEGEGVRSEGLSPDPTEVGTTSQPTEVGTTNRPADPDPPVEPAETRLDLDSLPLGIGYFSPQGRLVWANPALAQLLGYDSRQQLIDTITDVGQQLYVSPARRRQLETHLEQHHQVREFEAELYRADGNPTWVAETAWVRRNEAGEVVLIEETMRDITATKQIEQTILEQSGELEAKAAANERLMFQAQAAEAALRMLFNSLAVAIFLHTDQGEIVEVNNRVVELFGLSREAAQGMRFDQEFSAAENRFELLQRYWEQALAGQPQFFEWLARRPGDGQALEVEIFLDRVSLALTADQPPQDLILANVRDITERKQAERERLQLLQEAEHRSERLQTAAEISRAASSRLEVQELMVSSVNLIRDRFGFYYVGLFLVDGEWAVLQAGTGQAGEIQLTKGHRLKLGSTSMISWAIEHRQARIALDVGEEAVHFKNPVLPLTRSELALPLISRERTLGALTVQSVQEAAFTQEDITLLQTMADQLANAIHNAQLWQQTSQRTSELEQLYDVSRKLVEVADVAAVYQLVIETVKRYGVDRVSVSLLDRDTGGEIVAVRIVATWDRDPTQRTPVGTTFSAKNFSLVQTFAQPPFQPLISEDLSQPTQADARLDEPFRQLVYEQMKMQTMFSAPMFLGQEYRGVLSLYTRQPHQYSESEVRLYQMLADQAIIVIENHVLLERTRAERDRAALLSELGQALSRARTVAAVQQITLTYGERLWPGRAEIYVTDWQGLFSFQASENSVSEPATDSQQAHIAQVLAHVTELKRPVSRKGVQLSRTSFEITNLSDLEFGDSEPSQTELGNKPKESKIDRAWCVPLASSRSELEGALLIYPVTEEGFSEAQVALFEELGGQLAGALENVWLLHQSQTSLQETEILYQASRDFNGAQSLADLLQTLATYISRLEIDDLGLANDGPTSVADRLDFLAIARFEEGISRLGRPGPLWVPAAWLSEGGSEAVEGGRFEPEAYPFVEAFNSELATTIIYSQLSPAVQAKVSEQLAGRRSLLAVPLAAGNRWLGMLWVGSRAVGFDFPAAVVQQLTALGGQVAVVMQNLELAATTQQNLYRTELLSRLGEALLGAESQEAIIEACLGAVAETAPGRAAFMFMFRRAVSLEMVLAGAIDTAETPRTASAGESTAPPVEELYIGSRYTEQDFDFIDQILAGEEVLVSQVSGSEQLSETTQQRFNLMPVDSFMALPVWLAKEVGGFLLVAFEAGGVLVDPEHQSLYREIARRVSDALEYQRVLEEASYRARLLQTVSEISETATATLELSGLLPQTVNLIRDRLGFYHASIFLVDEYQKYAVVQASTGRAGGQMLARRHKLAVGGSSLVGRATGSGQPCLAADVYQAVAWFNNPLLPETRSELALPLISRGAVIGALDVQSQAVGAFTESDQTILQSLANQLANAIEAARAFAQNQQNLAEVQKLHQHYLHQEWASFVQEAAGGRHEWQFRRGLLNEFEAVDEVRSEGLSPHPTEVGTTSGDEVRSEGLSPHPTEVGTTSGDEVRSEGLSPHPTEVGTTSGDEVRSEGLSPHPTEVGTTSGDEVRSEGLSPHPTEVGTTSGDEVRSEGLSRLVEFPLRLRGQANLGWLGLEVSPELGGWDEDTRQIVEAVVAQAAQAMETARLFEQTQTAREEAEVLYRLVGALVQADSEPAMYETVLPPLLSTVGASRGGVVLLTSRLKVSEIEPGGNGRLGFAMSVEAERGLAVEVCWYDGTAMEWPGEEPHSHYGPLWPALADGQPLIINQPAQDARLAVWSAALQGVRQLVWLPLMIEDELWGGVRLEVTGSGLNVNERALNLGRAMVDQLAISLQNQRLLGETARRAVQLQTSAEVSRVASSILEPEEMLRQAASLIKERFGFHEVQIYLIDELQQQAVLQQSTGEVGQRLLALQHQVAIGSQTVIGQVTANRESLVVRHEESNAELIEPLPFPQEASDEAELGPLLAELAGAGIRAELGVPLQVGESLLGALSVQSTETDSFSPEEISTLETLAAQLSVALQNARQFKEQQAVAERLREVDKLKTQFLANMSHELRTPLNSIIGFSRVILKGIDGPLTELQKADLTSIHNSGQHLLGLINNMLDLSKIEAGKMELNLEDADIEPIIKQVMSTALALVKDKPVKLITKVADDIPTVWADPTRLRQVILNLVSNACKFTDEGEIVVRASASRDKVTVSVTDSGVGIPAEKLSSVFEEFTQVDASTTRKVGGTGLGLPISRHFVEMHQGQIWVESEPGRGSTFSFAIPIRPINEGEEGAAALADGSEGAKEKAKQPPAEPDNRLVVAIESDPKVVALYKRFLSKHGYEVIGINNSEEIVARVKHYAPSVILLDVLLPGVDGWSVLGELQKNSVTQAIPIIISSTVKDKNRAFSLGVADYLVKPIVETELVRALRNIESLERLKVKVLIIDDHADDVLLIRRMLEAQGNYKVIEASNGREGLKIVESMRPDLVICDLNMPEMNGYRVVEKMKKSDKTRQIPIIIVSAHELGSAERKYLDNQVEVLLHKALFTEQELLDDVHRALKRIGKE